MFGQPAAQIGFEPSQDMRRGIWAVEVLLLVHLLVRASSRNLQCASFPAAPALRGLCQGWRYARRASRGVTNPSVLRGLAMLRLLSLESSSPNLKLLYKHDSALSPLVLTREKSPHAAQVGSCLSCTLSTSGAR